MVPLVVVTVVNVVATTRITAQARVVRRTTVESHLVRTPTASQNQSTKTQTVRADTKKIIEWWFSRETRKPSKRRKALGGHYGQEEVK